MARSSTPGRRRAWAPALLGLAAIAACEGSPKASHRVTATVSGLAGSGLVLQVNGHDGVEVNADGEVVLTWMAGGSYYSVTVKTQPDNPAQTCTVANGTGTIGAVDVTDVAVTCATTYGIGGRVSGLVGDGLVLHLRLGEDAAEDLAVTDNGPFMFGSRVVPQTSYTVTVSRQPSSSRTEFCSVGNAAGSVGGADVLDLAVVCAPDAFEVSGTASGLVPGTEVVLQNNGADDLTVTGDGPFHFGLPVADGATYAVSVKTQPTGPWQTCRVEPGTGAGTIAGMAVDSVQVRCTIDTHAIRVHVSWLKGTGLVLRNGEDQLSVRGNGEWTFGSLVQSGSRYEVAVSEQPSSPGQSCAVLHGSGEVRDADVTDVLVTCDAFAAPQRVATAAPPARMPQVAMDSAGNAIAVWGQTDGVHWGAWASHRAASAGWDGPVLLQADAKEPRVAMDAAGNAMTVWVWEVDHVARARRYIAGSGWNDAEPLEVAGSGYSSSLPALAMSSTGTAQLGWLRGSATGSHAMVARRHTGVGWSDLQTISLDQGTPRVAINSAGAAVTVWDVYTGRVDLWASYSASGSAWSEPRPIEEGNGSAQKPEVAMDAAGNAIAVWFQYDGARDRICANRYTPGTGWGAAQSIEDDGAGDSEYPQIAMDSAGDAVVVWAQSDGTRSHIRANRYAAGSGWGVAQLIEQDDVADAGGPRVAMDEAGNAIVVWTQWDGSGSRLWANRYTAGVGWGTPQMIPTGDQGNPQAPHIAMNAAGNATVVWVQSNDVWASRY